MFFNTFTQRNNFFGVFDSVHIHTIYTKSWLHLFSATAWSSLLFSWNTQRRFPLDFCRSQLPSVWFCSNSLLNVMSVKFPIFTDFIADSDAINTKHWLNELEEKSNSLVTVDKPNAWNIAFADDVYSLQPCFHRVHLLSFIVRCDHFPFNHFSVNRSFRTKFRRNK